MSEISPPCVNGGFVCMPHEEFEALIRKLVAEVVQQSMSGEMQEVKSLLDAWRETKRCAWQTIVKIVTTAFLASIAAGVAFKINAGG